MVALDNVIAFILLAVFGFILSQDLVTGPKALLYLLSSRRHNRISRFLKSCCKQVYKRSFVSYSGITDIRQMSDSRSCLISLLLSSIKGATLLALGLVCVYFTVTLQDAGVRGVLIKIFSAIVFALTVAIFVSDSVQKPYFLGVFRNRLFPSFTGEISKYKLQRKKLYYASVPQKIILPYGMVNFSSVNFAVIGLVLLFQLLL